MKFETIYVGLKKASLPVRNWQLRPSGYQILLRIPVIQRKQQITHRILIVQLLAANVRNVKVVVNKHVFLKVYFKQK